MCDSREGWQRFYKLNRALLKKPLPIKPLLDLNGYLLHDSDAKAELFASTMEAQFTTPPHTSIFENVVRETLATQSAAPHSPTTFSPGKTGNVIRKLPNRRAPGPDGISNCALKYCGRKTISKMCNIYNCCLRAEYFSTNWKTTTIVMIPKPDKDQP